MAGKTLRVRARPGASVQNHERAERGENVFVAGHHEPDPDRPGGLRVVTTDDVVELPYRAEYRNALVAGDLIPADEQTARLVGLEWDASKAVHAPAHGGDS